MLKSLMQVVGGVFLAVTAVELESQGNSQKGEEKKKAAAEKFRQALDPFLPDWLNPILSAVLPMLINAVVAWANSTGFFGQLAAGSSNSLAKP